jgi:hypothetical protein
VPVAPVSEAVTPSLAASVRSRTISPTASALIADGELFGRRDRGSNAASPSVR